MRRGFSSIGTFLGENRPFLGAFPPWKDHKRSGSHNNGPGSGVEMTIGRFNDYYFGIESSVAPVSAAMRCTANHTGPVPRRRSRPKWSRPACSGPRSRLGKFPRPILGNELYANCQRRPQRLGNLGCSLRVEMDVFVLPRKKDCEARSLLRLSTCLWS